MAKKKKKKDKNNNKFEYTNEIIGVIIIFSLIFIILSIYSYIIISYIYKFVNL